MSVTAHLCGLKGDLLEVAATSPPAIRAAIAAHEGFAFVEPDLPIGRLALPRDLVARAILARVTRGPAARPLLFVRAHRGGLVKVKPERALDLRVSLLEPFPDLGALLTTGPLTGKELLRALRARRGAASTSDSANLGKALVAAWNDGLISLSVT